MSNEEVLKGNKLIADFLGWNKYSDGITYDFPNLYPYYNIGDENNTGIIADNIETAPFNTDWNWLMPCISKISNKCNDPEELDGLYYSLLTNNIEVAYNEVVNYLENV
jgi:hypothetical protein